MNKILLIIQREYVTRVRKKSFIIVTLLVPTLLASLFAVIAYVAKDKDQTQHVVSVIDNTGDFINKFQDGKYIKFTYSYRPLDVEKKDLKNDNDLVLNISNNKKDNME